MAHEIKITMTDRGEVNVTGPLHEKVLCLGLIEVAKQVIINYSPKALVTPTTDDIKRIEKT